MNRIASLALVVVGLSMAACNGSSELSGACELAAENQGCPECADGDVTCAYGDVVITALSCGGCQAEAAVIDELCATGVTDTRAEIEAGMDCAEIAE